MNLIKNKIVIILIILFLIIVIADFLFNIHNINNKTFEIEPYNIQDSNNIERTIKNDENKILFFINNSSNINDIHPLIYIEYKYLEEDNLRNKITILNNTNNELEIKSIEFEYYYKNNKIPSEKDWIDEKNDSKINFPIVIQKGSVKEKTIDYISIVDILPSKMKIGEKLKVSILINFKINKEIINFDEDVFLKCIKKRKM